MEEALKSKPPKTVSSGAEKALKLVDEFNDAPIEEILVER